MRSALHQICPPRAGHPSLARLAEGAALMERIALDRPLLIVNALLGGATPTEVTAVLGWDLADLRVAINTWVPKLRGQGLISERDRAAVNLAVAHIAFGAAE